jgi:hypothetical protein
MLDFRFPDETNGLLRGGVPEALLGESKRVEEANDRVALLSQNGKVVGGLHRHGSLGSDALSHTGSIEARGCECGGRGSQ